MRNILKAATIESKFPLLAVEHGCIVSKDADITVAYRVELPELFTVTSAEYEAIHAAWCKAVKVLPEYSIVHKQDWFIREQYRPQTGDAQMSFLSRSFERHFNERPYLNHSCFLFLTKTTKERMRMQSNFSTLCRGNIIPKEVDRESTTKFLEAVDQFERILNDSGFISITRLSGDEIRARRSSRGCWRSISRCRFPTRPRCRMSSWEPRRCVWATSVYACIRSPTRRICRDM